MSLNYLKDFKMTTQIELKINDKIKLYTASQNHGVCTVTKIMNYKTKGQRVYIESQWGYGFKMWFNNMNYENV